MKIDKLLHLLAGLALVAMAWPLGKDVSLTLCVVVALAKEFYDYLHPDAHTADGLDALATVVGGLLSGAWLQWGVPSILTLGIL